MGIVVQRDCVVQAVRAFNKLVDRYQYEQLFRFDRLAESLLVDQYVIPVEEKVFLIYFRVRICPGVELYPQGGIGCPELDRVGSPPFNIGHHAWYGWVDKRGRVQFRGWSSAVTGALVLCHRPSPCVTHECKREGALAFPRFFTSCNGRRRSRPMAVQACCHGYSRSRRGPAIFRPRRPPPLHRVHHANRPGCCRSGCR